MIRFCYKYKRVLSILRRQLLISMLPLLAVYYWQGDWQAYLLGVLVILMPHFLLILCNQLWVFMTAGKVNSQDLGLTKIRMTAARLMTFYFVRLILIILGIVLVFVYILQQDNAIYFILGIIMAAVAYVIAGFKQYYIVGE